MAGETGALPLRCLWHAVVPVPEGQWASGTEYFELMGRYGWRRIVIAQADQNHVAMTGLIRSRAGSRMAQQELQGPLIELFHLFINRRVRASFKNQQLGIANATV